jgi:hypothetical protein
MNFSTTDGGNHLLPPIRTLHQHTQSVGATGGVYKGQGRNQRRLFQETGPLNREPLNHLHGKLLRLFPWTLSTAVSVRPPKGHLSMEADYILSQLLDHTSN